jgi:hypothetical protein
MFSSKKKKLIFTNQVYRVYINEIKGKDFYVKDFLSIDPITKNKQGYGGVSIITIYKEYYYLMRVYSPIVKRYFYSLPQGFVEKKETLKASAKRELNEELGVNEKNLNISKLSEVFPFNNLINGKLAIFKALLKKQISSNLAKSEVGTGKILKIHRKNLIRMLKHPKKFDLITFTCLMHFLYNKNNS